MKDTKKTHVVAVRLTNQQLRALTGYADARKITHCAAIRLILCMHLGLEHMRL